MNRVRFWVFKRKDQSNCYYREDEGDLLKTVPLPEMALKFFFQKDAEASFKVLPTREQLAFEVCPVSDLDISPLMEIETLLQRKTSTPVYFIYSPESGHIKIGRSIDPGKRLKELQTGSSSELRLLAVTTCYEERELHDYFANCRVQGEWFHATADLCGFIEGLR
jgi:hypothetical protein